MGGQQRRPPPQQPKPGPSTDHYVQGWKAGLMYARHLMVNSGSFAEARVKVDKALRQA